jgi:hypothetical protein
MQPSDRAGRRITPGSPAGWERHNIVGSEVGHARPPVYLRPGRRRRRTGRGRGWLILVLAFALAIGAVAIFAAATGA